MVPSIHSPDSTKVTASHPLAVPHVLEHLYFISEGCPGATMAQVRKGASGSDLMKSWDIESIHHVLCVRIQRPKFLSLLTVGDVSE